jgi:conjugative transfer signal peptidase TraF
VRSATIAAAVVAAVIGSIVAPPPLLLVWNTTASTPIGLYAVTQATPKRGDLLVMRLPREMQLLAVSRAILSPNSPVLKPVAALAGDLVCRSGLVVHINGRFAAIARNLDQRGRRLPAWRGCRRLSPSQVFLLSHHPDSFDSRYYGPLDTRRACGIAHPLVTFAD